MRKCIMLVAGIIAAGLFMACPKQELPANSSLQIQIQGHIYDSQSKQPVPDAYIGVFLEVRNQYGMTLTNIAETRTRSDGSYSLQCSLAKEPCQNGTRLYLAPPASTSDTGAGTQIGCTSDLQTIDLYK